MGSEIKILLEDRPYTSVDKNLNDLKEREQQQMVDGSVMSNGSALQFPAPGVLPNGAVGSTQENFMNYNRPEQASLNYRVIFQTFIYHL